MKRVASILAVVLLVVCGIGTVAYRQYQSVQQKLEANKSKLGTVETGDLVVQVVESGTIDAVKVVEVKSRASGRLAELLVEEGDLVSRGDLIARIGADGAVEHLADPIYHDDPVGTDGVLVFTIFGLEMLVRLAEIYEAVRGHPKTRTNSQWQAAIRRTLKVDPELEKAARGIWRIRILR